MKKILILFMFSFSFVSCEKEFDEETLLGNEYGNFQLNSVDKDYTIAIGGEEEDDDEYN